MFDEREVALLLQAFKYAAHKHRGQHRKDGEASPYINHPIDVVEILWRVGGVRDVSVLIAAVLHDTIEDTDATPEQVAATFGDEIAALVQEVTDDKTLPKAVRKQLQIENAPHKSGAAKLIKLADKISNVRDVGFSPPASWSRDRRIEYLNWSEKVVAGLRGTNQSLEDRYDDILAQARARLE
ncbi:MAG: HD domain-containing protein [Chloroflexota bacterium]|nr:HD domain-containing protein [Chloroflexota bacterium]